MLVTAESEDRHIGGVRVECYNWYGRHGSSALTESEALTRSLLDVTTEIAVVAESLHCPPILAAHSMGPSLAYAAAHPVAALVLVAPVLPAGFDADLIDLPVDPTSMWMPPPDLIAPVWWPGVTDDDTRGVDVPALAIAGGADALIPAQVDSLAKAIDTTFILLEVEGHGIPVNPVWRRVTVAISEWLSRWEIPAE